MMPSSLHQHIAEHATLSCAVAKRFARRPALLEIAGQLLLEHWAARGMTLADNPLGLYLVSQPSSPESAHIRLLPHVLIERYCLGQTLNLSEGENYLSRQPEPGRDTEVNVDLHSLELLINACGPLIVEAFLQALVEFWSRSDEKGQTPWQWYADYLQNLMKNAIKVEAAAGKLTPAQAATASIVISFPDPQQRSEFANLSNLKVYGASVDLTPARVLDADLSSALLIEQLAEPTRPAIAIVFTMVGALMPYQSRQGFLDMLARNWPRALLSQPAEATFSQPAISAFEAQAGVFLTQQLRLIEVFAASSHTFQQAISLNAIIDRATSMLDLCTAEELERQYKIASLLPSWLLESKLALLYSTLLIDLAQSTKEAAGKSWHEGIDSVEVFACKALDAQIRQDHPEVDFHTCDVLITNKQVIAAAIPLQGSLITDGSIRVVTFSLARLAIDNLGLLAAGTVNVHLNTGGSLPHWMDEDYVRHLVRELDIGAKYPQFLQQQLLGDPDQAQTRRKRFTAQLKVQLPMLAVELHLRNKVLTEPACHAVNALFGEHLDSSYDQARSAPVLRPLALLRENTASADPLLNAWLIEPIDARQGPCLLYRPLHAEPLLEFHDRIALFDALCIAGPLQEDILDRLQPETRPIYANGGLREPHVHRFVPGAEFERLQTPPPATLSLKLAQGPVRELIYQASAEELIERGRRNSTSTTQSRWDSWKQLGWLMFNTLLPLFEGNVAKVAWMVQVLDSAQRLLQNDAQTRPREHHQAFVDLMINIAMVLFVHATRRLGIQPAAPAKSTVTHSPLPPAGNASSGHAITFAPRLGLSFSWARPDHRLTTHQQTELQRLATSISPSSLSSPIPGGPLQGLYLHEETLCFIHAERVYQVVFDASANQPHIVAPDSSGARGPWLRKDEAGRWALDLRLRLQGGQPLRNRPSASQLQEQIDSLDQALRAQTTEAQATQQHLQKAVGLISDDAHPRILQGYLDKLQNFADLLERHVTTLHERNGKRPIKQYKVLRAKGLYEHARCELSILSTLGKLYRPLRKDFVEAVRATDGALPEPGSSQRPAQIELLEQMDPLLGKLINHTETLTAVREHLHKLASISQPAIRQLEQTISEAASRPTSRLYWYTLRSELLSNRLRLLPGEEPSNEADYWLEHSWRNIEHGMLQRMNLLSLSSELAEVHARLLENIQRHFTTALRQLGNLKSLLAEHPAGNSLVTRLESDVSLMLKETQADLQDYPQPLREHSSLRQLNCQVPGLIETREDGVLLGRPRPDSEDIVDIHNPQDDSVTASYRADPASGAWESLTPTRAELPQVTHSALGPLLREGNRLVELATQDIQRLKNQTTGSYLPIEIEEIAERRRLPLIAQRQAIERTLTQTNQTDQAVGSSDAAVQIKLLDTTAAELLHTGEQLRIDAALAQPPSMRELEYLLGKKKVRLKAVGTRRLLAKTREWPQDFLDEYVVLHNQRPLWYAHFHYAAESTPKDDFKAAHLKLASQRYDRGQFVDDVHSQRLAVHRGPISLAAARQWFFTT